MINKYTNKQRGLLAVIMAMVMVFAGAAFVAAEVDADADDALKAVANGFTVEYEDTLKTTISGETISFEGYVVMEKDLEYSAVFDNIYDYWGTVRITDLKGDMNIKQTNTAFEIAYPGLHDNNVKQQDYKLGEKGDDLMVLVPKDGSTVQLEFTTGTGESAVTKKLNLDFSKVSTMIVLGDDNLSGTGWEYTSQELSFTNYNGREVFTLDDSFNGTLTINFSGENTISAYAYTYADDDGIHGSSVINVYVGDAPKALDVIFTDGSSANITMNTPYGMGIVAGTTTITGGSDETLTINGANRGLYSVGDLTVTNMTIISTASEYAVRVYDGCTFNVNNSKVTSIISDPKGNEQGYDNINGIKTGSITIDGNSEVKTYGLYVTGNKQTGDGSAIGDLILVKGYKAYVAEGVTINGSICSDDNASSITFSNCKAAEAFEITAGSIILEDGTKISSGDVIITGNAIVKGEVTVKDIVLADGATLTIEEGATLGATSITFAGTPVEAPKVIVKGTLDATVDANEKLKVEVQPGAITNGVTGNIDYKDSFGMSQDLESDYTVKTNAFLEKDLTIPKDVTLTVEGTLDLNGNKLTVIGNLVVSKKGVIESNHKSEGSILLSKTGVISNIGMIGNTTQVVIGNTDGTETVTMKGVSGIEFSLTKVNAAYKLTVSGEAAIKVKESNLLTITGAYLSNGFTVKDVQEVTINNGTILKDATVTIGSKAVVAATITEMQNGSTLIVNGVIAGAVNMVNGAEVIINGESDATYRAETGDFKTYGDDNKKQTAEQATTTDITTIVTGDLKGITISVTTRSYTAQDADKTPMTEQKLLVSGIAAVADGKDKDAEATLTVTGKAYIAEGSELVIPDEVIINTDNIIPEGLLKVVDPTDDPVDDSNDDVVVFVGTKYTITITDEATYDETVTDYYTTFDAAYAAIADADEMTITISGGYEFAKDYIIAAGQTVEAAAGETGGFTIAKDGTITIQDEGVLELPNLDVKGILTVIYGADCDVDDLTYEVMSKNTETGDITYSGAELAIENAVAGDVIDIVDDVVFKDPVTIAEGVTVNVEDGASITAEKGLTVAGKLVNEGTVGIADEYDLIVTGEIENEGTITLGTESEMTVTGTAVSDDAISGTINAASYTDEDNNIVYTTVASAVASGEDVAVSGRFTENADVVLAEEQTLTINGEVVLKSIRLVAGSTLTVGTDGILTADVIAAVGTEETTGALSDAVVDVTKINNISGWTVNYNEAKATYTMVIPAYTSGDVVIEAGSVNYNDANASFGAVTGSTPVVYKTMKVASGATLVVTGNVTDDASKKYFVNEGTIIVSDNKNFTNVLLGGTVNVDLGKTLTLTASQIVGEVVLATEEGKTPASVAISGQVLIGSTPKTLGAAGSIVGKVTFATANDYVVVFEGSTFNNTDDSVKTLSTAYTINDIAFATVYTTVQNVDVTVINKIVAGLKDLDVPNVDTVPAEDPRDYSNDIVWKSGSLKATAVGQYDAVNAKIGYKSVSFIVAVGPGLQVYIDDVEYSTMIEDGKVTETIGTHTVTVYLQKGYEGTPAITFNGQTITDGKLVLTSDMIDKENKLVVTGATVMQDQPVVIQPSDSEKDGMELTDILLIVLVVLIVIMAIIVALRMMRS